MYALSHATFEENMRVMATSADAELRVTYNIWLCILCDMKRNTTQQNKTRESGCKGPNSRESWLTLNRPMCVTLKSTK